MGRRHSLVGRKQASRVRLNYDTDAVRSLWPALIASVATRPYLTRQRLVAGRMWMPLNERRLENGTRIDRWRVVHRGSCDGLDVHSRDRDHERFSHAREHGWRKLSHRHPHHAVAHERRQCANVVIRTNIVGGAAWAIRPSAAVQQARELLTSMQRQKTICSLYIF